jgi:hypothetical protein
MPKLSISCFSCIDRADIELGEFTILVGPQASGKSIISKLSFFFYDILAQQYLAIEEGRDSKAFLKRVGDDFQSWFPSTAWGRRRMRIRFEAGPISFEVTRKTARSGPTDEVNVKASQYFLDYHDSILARAEARRSRRKAPEDDDDEFGIVYQAWYVSQSQLAKDMGQDYVSVQTFIPAGRAFFTSLGKAFVAFEEGGILDPVTNRFGRSYARLRERGIRSINPRFRPDDDLGRARHALMQRLFGGEVKFERGKEFVQTEDKRKIPISALSSGQQELLPLWMVLSGVTATSQGSRGNDNRRMVYIEEPEAHLFPTAQSALIEYLAALSRRRDRLFRLLITTHSPYVLAKINNLIKAGSLGAKKSLSEQVASIVDRDSWLARGKTRAYAIIDRQVTDIIDKEGLIDGEYLDMVSRDIEREFNQLLDIEYPSEN